jgi:glutamate-1-semialdehyde 2,1-aminomutase
MTDDVATRLAKVNAAREAGHSGMGTTLSASALQMAAIRATLEQVMTAENYAHMERLAERLVTGLSEAIRTNALPWHALRVGARVEFVCAPGPLLNGAEAEAAHAPELEGAIHTGLINRGSLIAPFHNMMLVSPATTKTQVDRLVDNFADIASRLAA